MADAGSSLSDTMSSTRRSLSAFLKEAQKTLKAPAHLRPRPLTLVVGNESADLDSICSAVVLAYLFTHTPPHKLHIPIASIPRSDLALRPELATAFQDTGVSPEDIPTLTELPASSTDDPPLNLVLVDHNVPTGPFSLSQPNPPKIVGCIDHHKDEGVTPPDASPRIIETVGSCMSLVLRRVAESHARNELSADKASDAGLGKLALAPVLVDTGCLKVASRTTEVDVAAVAVAEKLIHGKGEGTEGREKWRGEYEREVYYEELQRMKGDVSRLSFRDVLRKDYKEWAEGGGDDTLVLGVPAIPQELGKLINRPGEGREGFLKAVRAWAKEQALDIVAVMTMFQREDGVGEKGGFKRELLVWALTTRAVEAAQLFAKWNEERLRLKTWRDGELDIRSGDGAEWRACWDQENTDCSRKQVGPWLREAMAASTGQSY